MLLKILQISQENTYVFRWELYSKSNSDNGVFLRILQNYAENLFYKTQLGEYFSGLTKVEQTILFNETRKMDGVNFKDTAQVLQKIFDLLSRHFSSCAWMWLLCKQTWAQHSIKMTLTNSLNAICKSIDWFLYDVNFGI